MTFPAHISPEKDESAAAERTAGTVQEDSDGRNDSGSDSECSNEEQLTMRALQTVCMVLFADGYLGYCVISKFINRVKHSSVKVKAEERLL